MLSASRSHEHLAAPTASCLVAPGSPSKMKRSVSWGDFQTHKYDLTDDEVLAKRGEKNPIVVSWEPNLGRG